MGPSLALSEFTVWPGESQLSLCTAEVSAQMLLPQRPSLATPLKVAPHSVPLPFLASLPLSKRLSC